MLFLALSADFCVKVEGCWGCIHLCPPTETHAQMNHDETRTCRCPREQVPPTPTSDPSHSLPTPLTQIDVAKQCENESLGKRGSTMKTSHRSHQSHSDAFCQDKVLPVEQAVQWVAWHDGHVWGHPWANHCVQAHAGGDEGLCRVHQVRRYAYPIAHIHEQERRGKVCERGESGRVCVRVCCLCSIGNTLWDVFTCRTVCVLVWLASRPSCQMCFRVPWMSACSAHTLLCSCYASWWVYLDVNEQGKVGAIAIAVCERGNASLHPYWRRARSYLARACMSQNDLRHAPQLHHQSEVRWGLFAALRI
jgi:hypothetical protein